MSTKDRLQKLMLAKEELEAKIAHNGDILTVNDNVGMSGPLVDNEGYPRNDIDVYQVRQARQQIICLQNDYKELMSQIHTLLNEYHEETRANNNDPQEANNAAMAALNVDPAPAVDANKIHNTNAAEMRAIVKVNLVSPNSPAEEAGLCVGDKILQFGTITAENFSNDLNQIGNLVRHMQNERILLKVKRNGNILDMMLIPKTWSGRGLLGCNIVLCDDEVHD